MENKLIISAAPHLHKDESIAKIMWLVFVSLIPAGVAGVVIFGFRALVIIVIALSSALLAECVIQKLRKQKLSLGDGSAAITGLLLGYNLAANVPLWIPVVGSLFAIIIVKQAFGGLGKNIFNSTLAARAFLLIAWPQYMTSFVRPFTQPLRAWAGFSVDAVTAATPLAMLKEGKADSLAGMGLNYWDMFLGRHGGCLGEVCILALLLGAIFLLWKGYITLHTPISFIATTAVFSWIFDQAGLFKGDILFTILSGGLVLGAFFMATDYVTSPLTRKGQVIFGCGCGLLTFVIRRWGGYPEGVSFSILMMNAVVPLIDRYVRPRILGAS